MRVVRDAVGYPSLDPFPHPLHALLDALSASCSTAECEAISALVDVVAQAARNNCAGVSE